MSTQFDFFARFTYSCPKKNKTEADREYIFGTYDAEAVYSFETTTQQSQQRNISLHGHFNSGHSNAVFTVYCGLAIKPPSNGLSA
jgi:hypothetical protein